MGLPLSTCAPNYVNSRQTLKDYKYAQTNKITAEYPFCCRYHPDLEYQREQMEKEKFQRLSKKKFISLQHTQSLTPKETTTPSEQEPISEPSPQARRDRVANGALIQQSKHHKLKQQKKQLKQNKPPRDENVNNTKPSSICTNTDNANVNIDGNTNGNTISTPSEAEPESQSLSLNISGSNEIIEHIDEYSVDQYPSNHNQTSTSSPMTATISRPFPPHHDDIFNLDTTDSEGDIFATSSSKDGSMMVDGDENSLYKERLSVSYNQTVVEQEKKFVIRLTSPSLNEYELKGTGLPLNVSNSFEGDTSTTNSSEDEETEETEESS